jgi:hypothetical protein
MAPAAVEPLVIPRLLDVEDIQRICGVGTNHAYQILHAAGPIP